MFREWLAAGDSFSTGVACWRSFLYFNGGLRPRKLLLRLDTGGGDLKGERTTADGSTVRQRRKKK